MIRNLVGAVALAAALFPVPAATQDVTLTSADGALRVSGDLVAWDGQFLRLDTAFGPLTLDARGLDCAGPGCPLLRGAVAESLVVGPPVGVWRVLPVLLAGFAAEQGLELDSRTDGDAILHDLIDPWRDAPVMRLRVLATDAQAAAAAVHARSADLAVSLFPADDLRAQILAYQPLVPLQPAPGALALDDFLAVLGGADAAPVHLLADIAPDLGALSAPFAPLGADLHPTAGALLSALLDDPLALALGTPDMAALAPVTLTQDCALPLGPTPFAVHTGAWPLAQPIYALHRGERLPLRLRQLLAYAAGPAAAAVLRAGGLTDSLPEVLPPAGMRDRLLDLISARADDWPADLMRQVAGLAAGAAPLSLALRFEAGTDRIDAPSGAVVQRLAEMAGQGRFDDRHLTFVGFTDADGPFEVNLRLSQARAESVRRAFMAALADGIEPPETAAQGFGPLMPLACEQGRAADWARGVNRRVEVWLR